MQIQKENHQMNRFKQIPKIKLSKNDSTTETSQSKILYFKRKLKTRKLKTLKNVKFFNGQIQRIEFFLY